MLIGFGARFRFQDLFQNSKAQRRSLEVRACREEIAKKGLSFVEGRCGTLVSRTPRFVTVGFEVKVKSGSVSSTQTHQSKAEMVS